MKTTHLMALAICCVTVTAARAALITDPNDPRSWQGASVGTFAALYFGSNTPATRQLVVDNQLLDDGLFSATGFTPGTLLATPWSLGTGGGTSPYPGVAGGARIGGGCIGASHDMTGTGSYAYHCGATDLFTAANAIDELWFQSSNTIGDTIFDLGGEAAKAAVFNTIDHGPLPREAIESTVFLSNDRVTWMQAVVERVWLEGFMPNTGIHWDGFVYAVGTGTAQTFRYVSIIHGGPGALVNDGDDEINGVLGLNADFDPCLVNPDVDCNNNDVSDDCDIAEGTSEDCNENAVPDECDIAGGTSLDNNDDGVPDECNTPPTCDADGPYHADCAGTTTSVVVDGSGSVDADGDMLDFWWSTDCPGGAFDDPTDATTTLTVDTTAWCTLTCTATLEIDDGTASESCSATVTVTDATGPTILCGVPRVHIPFVTPETFSTSATDVCCGDHPATSITAFDCRPGTCSAQIGGDTITFTPDVRVGDVITWTVESTDCCGNTAQRVCRTRITKPRLLRGPAGWPWPIGSER